MGVRHGTLSEWAVGGDDVKTGEKKTLPFSAKHGTNYKPLSEAVEGHLIVFYGVLQRFALSSEAVKRDSPKKQNRNGLYGCAPGLRLFLALLRTLCMRSLADLSRDNSTRGNSARKERQGLQRDCGGPCRIMSAMVSRSFGYRTRFAPRKRASSSASRRNRGLRSTQGASAGVRKRRATIS